MSPSSFASHVLSRVSTATLAFALITPDSRAQTSQPLAPVTVDAPRPRAATTPTRPIATRTASRRIVRQRTRVPVAAAQAVPTALPVFAAGQAPIDRDPAGGGLAPAGLNLTRIAPSGSRLNLTPFETPASVEIIPGQVARDRGQRTVQEAVTQDATGYTFIGAPVLGYDTDTYQIAGTPTNQRSADRM